MIKKIIFSVSIFGLSLSAFAGVMGNSNEPPFIPLYVGAYGGYGHFDGGYTQGGNVTLGRFALGLHLKEYNSLLLGSELGFQSGNSMRLFASPEIIEAAGSLPIQSSLKPLVDFLVTLKGQFKPASPIFYLLKGGVAYRQLELEDRSSPHDTLNKINGEFQAGLGCNITSHVMLTAFYQGIYSSSQAGVELNVTDDVTISKIPTQQAGFIGVEYSFF